ncbi:MAG: DegT/DnrJ/EryC1/StrS family aminotransferase, partial [Lysobacter sp.]|nr:DegT/DnrJ/EryC1/StrS family aminotransferase [Lysobacter sp.]
MRGIHGGRGAGPGRAEYRHAKTVDDHPALGYNSRLDELQAVVLRTKLKRIDAFNEARRRIAGLYTAAFAGLPGVVVPCIDAGGQHVFHQYTLLVADREGLVAGLQQRGVGCAVHYLRLIPEQRS